MAESNPHQLMVCPYNKAHSIESYRMHIHLQKCRKQYPNAGVATCPFDATHIIRDAELNYHVQNCPKRILLDSQMYAIDDDYCPQRAVLPTPSDIPSTELWEEGESSYNPQEAKKGAPIITKALKGATKSERNAARIAGRLAYTAALKQQQGGSGSS